MKGLGIKIKHVDSSRNPSQSLRYEERHQIFTECMDSILKEDSELDMDIAIDRAVDTMK